MILPLFRSLLLLAMALWLGLTPAAARADDGEFCAERPGQTTPPCVTPTGHVMLESGIAAWQRQDDAESRTDSWSFANSQLRVGLGKGVEAQIGWQMAGYSRSTDLANHTHTSASRIGDVTLGLLYGPGGGNGPVAVQIFASLPVGRVPVGAGDWGGGARLPVALSIGHGWQLGLTPEIDAAVNQGTKGRHLAFGGTMGLGHGLSNSVSLGMDVSVMRDLDPTGSSNRAMTTASLAWQAGTNTQFDVGGGAGLNRDSPALQVYLGVARRF